MKVSEIRSRFLKFFEARGHTVLPSASLVPSDDPTLLFTNAGMVPFKRIFLGVDSPPGGNPRATTSQKCVRAGGKHNDLEQVGHTARHHTFFEMLGNFSFGDYFKRDAISYAWELITKEYGIDPKHLRVTVFHSDDEARALWKETSGFGDDRVYGLGEKDNFWQMADTGPCGPCSEIYVDLAQVARDWTPPQGEFANATWADPLHTDLTTEEFIDAAEQGRFVEIWNLVFMQFDRQPDGELVPLPKPSVDTGAGLERIAAVMQGVANNFDTDVFAPLIEAVRNQVSDEAAADIAAMRVIADHSRAVAFLLADGVFPSNEGRGYVLRRILRRGVRYAYLLGRREPTMEKVVAAVIESMGDIYPGLIDRKKLILQTTRAEEERFLATIEGGMRRFEELAPEQTTHERVIAGDDAFKLYDTYGFPLDLTELMARERDYTVDTEGFYRSLAVQRKQSQEERKSKGVAVSVDDLGDLESWQALPGFNFEDGRFVGYDVKRVNTQTLAYRDLGDERAAIILVESPFYAESGGQVSDTGEIIGEGWRLDVDDVKKVGSTPVAIGKLEGEFVHGSVLAQVPHDRRLDTERNHTATHLLHAALREVLGDHVRQAGSLVSWDRLRFDFTNNGPMSVEQLRKVEEIVNAGVLSATALNIQEKTYQDAIDSGAMALFGEKYGSLVRVVDIPSLSTELCGGTHVRNTAEIAYFKIISESGVAAGVRRIEAATGPKSFSIIQDQEENLRTVMEMVKGSPATVIKRITSLLEEKKALEKRIVEMMKGEGGGGPVKALIESATPVNGLHVIAKYIAVPDMKSLQEIAEATGEQMPTAVTVLTSTFDGGKSSLVVSVGQDARAAGARADTLVKELAQRVGGRGGGKPHLAQAGIPDATAIPALLEAVTEVVAEALAGV